MLKYWTCISLCLAGLYFNCTVTAEQNIDVANAASIRVPDSWKDASDTKPDLDRFFQNLTTGAVFSIVREDPQEMEIYDMEEYTKATIEQYTEAHASFQPGKPKAGEINGLVSHFFQGPLELEHDGKKYDFNLLVMTIKGKTHFYTLAANIPQLLDPATATKEALAVMKSFRERP